MAVITVDEADDRAGRRRFLELAFALHREHPEWAPPVLRFERRRLDRRLNPYLADAEAAFFLARRDGQVVGRIAAHRAPEGGGRFGFFDVADDEEAALALVDAARAWLREREANGFTGPLSFTPDQEAGVLIEGFDRPGLTGRPWHPPHTAAFLAAAGLEVTERRHSYRLDAGGHAIVAEASRPTPDAAGAYGDPALVLAGAGGTISAVPDVSAALRAAGAGGAWHLARRARRRDWETCVVVELDGDATVLVPAICGAAGRAGYRSVIAPWAPDDREPETVHALFTGDL
jgi:hypothetical protein